jgi:hypothetical protein
MRTVRVFAVALVAVLLAGSLALAHDEKTVTVTGKLMCTHCTLHEKDAKGCQDVLVVEEKEQKVHYYLAKNEVAEKFGHACAGEKKATVTGTVAKKDGKTWITAAKIEETKG